jgi:hypothetical protein
MYSAKDGSRNQLGGQSRSERRKASWMNMLQRKT